MTTPTPTSETVPAGVPDPLMLARLAGEFFAALPSSPAPGVSTSHPAPPPSGAFQPPQAGAGQALPAGGGSAPGGSGVQASPAFLSTPSHGAEPLVHGAGGTPVLAPVAPPSQAPAGSGVPRASNATPGVPHAYAAALPGLELPAPLSAGAAFYVLEGGHGYPAGGELLAPELPLSGSGLPGMAELNAFLGSGPAAGAPASARQDPGSHFYFLDPLAGGGVTQARPTGAAGLDVNVVRRDFPILQERVNGKQLVWFDNAATTQKPQSVIDRIAWFYAHENSNIHRAAHELAARATDAYEAARQKVADFLGAGSPDEIVFVRGATEAINLVAKSWGSAKVGKDDEIVVSHLEHHANIVPWQQLAAEKGARIRVIPVDDSGQVRLDAYRALLGPRTRIVAVTQVSNALGTVTPVAEMVAMAHSVGAVALIDGAQAVSHMPVNLRALDADFYVFSGHKVFGPTGIGAVYGKKALLDASPPWQGGGNMIVDVTFERTVYHAAPARFEAGTGNIADAVGLGAAIDYVQQLGLERIGAYEHGLLEYATHLMCAIPGLRMIGTAAEKASVLSFVLEGYPTEEVGTAFNKEGIAVRSGHHCAQPILRRFGLEATVRPSLAFYNTCEEVDRMIRVLRSLPRRSAKR